MALRHIDCFSGVGGIATGFHAAGIETVLAIEKVESCVDTYKANHPNVTVLNSDIRSVSEADILKECAGNVDIVTAGMPCETFSTAGKSSRSFYDSRQTLFDEAIRIAVASKAKIVLFENVPGFANKKLEKDGDLLVIDFLRQKLKENGFFNVNEVTLNAKDYGVPQNRDRIFILASKMESLDLFSRTQIRPVSVGEAFMNAAG